MDRNTKKCIFLYYVHWLKYVRNFTRNINASSFRTKKSALNFFFTFSLLCATHDGRALNQNFLAFLLSQTNYVRINRKIVIPTISIEMLTLNAYTSPRGIKYYLRWISCYFSSMCFRSIKLYLHKTKWKFKTNRKSQMPIWDRPVFGRFISWNIK